MVRFSIVVVNDHTGDASPFLHPLAPMVAMGDATAMTHFGDAEVSVCHDLTFFIRVKTSIGNVASC